MPKHFRKKALEVEAVQWTGENREEVIRFLPPLSPCEFGLSGELSLRGRIVCPGTYLASDPRRLVIRVPQKEFEATYEPVDQPGQGVEESLVTTGAAKVICEEVSGLSPENSEDVGDVLRALERIVGAQPVKETYTREQLLSDEAVRAQHAFLFPGTEYEGRHAYPSILGSLEAALEAIDKGKGGEDG